jgi:hypothetical protein
MHSLLVVNRRVIGIFLVLLLLGLGAGYAVASSTTEEPGRLAGPEPLPAVSPAAPTVTPIEVQEDPDTPALETNLPVVRELLQNAEDEPGLRVDRPEGWRAAGHGAGQREWAWSDPSNLKNTYRLRIELLKGTNASVSGAKEARLGELRATLEDGNFQELVVESNVANTFVVSYVDAEGFARVEMDRFVILDDTQDAYAVVAVTGRERDRAGIEDLVVRTAQSMVAVDPVEPDESDESEAP